MAMDKSTTVGLALVAVGILVLSGVFAGMFYYAHLQAEERDGQAITAMEAYALALDIAKDYNASNGLYEISGSDYREEGRYYNWRLSFLANIVKYEYHTPYYDSSEWDYNGTPLVVTYTEGDIDVEYFDHPTYYGTYVAMQTVIANWTIDSPEACDEMATDGKARVFMREWDVESGCFIDDITMWGSDTGQPCWRFHAILDGCDGDKDDYIEGTIAVDANTGVVYTSTFKQDCGLEYFGSCSNPAECACCSWLPFAAPALVATAVYTSLAARRSGRHRKP